MSFFVLIGLFLYTIIAYYSCKAIWKKTRSKKVLALWIAAFVLIATWDNIIGEITYFYLCKTQGGVRIYKTVDGVEGYFDADGKYGFFVSGEDLLKGTYKYIEVEVTEPKVEQESTSRPFKKGRYRFTIEKAGSKKCEFFYRDMQERPGSDFKKYPKEYCLAVEKVDEFKSRYAYSYLEKTDSHYQYPLVHIRKLESRAWDMSTGEILGTATSFQYYGGWMLAEHLDGGAIKKCPYNNVIESAAMHQNLLHQTLMPAKAR